MSSGLPLPRIERLSIGRSLLASYALLAVSADAFADVPARCSGSSGVGQFLSRDESRSRETGSEFGILF